MLNTNESEIRLHGINVSPGICIGKAYLVGKEGVDVVDKCIKTKCFMAKPSKP
jgi:phosphotransferase system enzyme I (PtsI)